MRTGVVSFKSITNPESIHRLDAPVHMTEGVLTRKLVAKSPYPLLTIGDVSKRIWHAGRWRRVYVTNPKHGITLLGSSAILKADVDNEKLVSIKYTEDIEDKILKAGWTLISCSGTIGNCAFANAKHAEKLASQHVIRLWPNNMLRGGLVYAYLASKYGYAMLTQGTFGSVIQHIEPQNVESIPIPSFPDTFQKEVDDLIQESARLREEAADMLSEAERLLKTSANLRDLTPEDYDYFGPRGAGREVSCFVRKRKDITTTTFNAFNLSERIKVCILNRLNQCNTISFYDAIDENKLQSPSGVEVNEVKEGHGIMLINQSDIFNQIVKGKYISKKEKYTKDLLKKGEILIAKIGTLGENETFCRCVYVGEELEGQLVSSAFYRMKPIIGIPSGYLYAWLSSDYGFRLLRSSQFGTKQCYPNPAILYKYPIPILSVDIMNKIDKLVKEAHTKRYEANENERKAIRMVEEEIEKWNT